MTLAYRMRLFSLDRWNLWPRLTFYRTWRDEDGERLDGTNNATERVIGWWVKERYRTISISPRCLRHSRRGGESPFVDEPRQKASLGDRPRRMRGYKRQQSVLNVSRLTAWAGSQLNTGGADLATVVN